MDFTNISKHPQHPWQSWRDHWIKQLKGKASPFSLPLNAPPTPPSDLPLVRDNLATMEEPKELKAPSGITKLRSASFQEEDAEALMENGASILEIHPDNVAEAWEKWAHVYDVSSSTKRCGKDVQLTLDPPEATKSYRTRLATILGRSCMSEIS